MGMPVVKVNEGGTSSVAFIDLEDILYFTVNKSKLCVQTLDGMYYLPSSLEDCAMIEGFEKLDRPFVVQKDRIQYIDDKYNVVYFDDAQNISCTISASNMRWAKHEFYRRGKLKEETTAGSREI